MIAFKDDRIRGEWGQLPQKNMALFECLEDLSKHIATMYQKSVVITSIYRTLEENAELYKTTPPDKIPKSQPHCTWNALDLRSFIYTDDEIKAICNYLNTKWKNSNGKVTAIYHKINGNVPHFHIQRW